MAADDCSSFVGDRHGPGLLEFVSHAGKPGVEERQCARVKIVGVARLRRALAMQGSIRKVIALDEGDAVEVGCEYTRGQQTCRAASQHDGVSKTRFHHKLVPPGPTWTSTTAIPKGFAVP